MLYVTTSAGIHQRETAAFWLKQIVDFRHGAVRHDHDGVTALCSSLFQYQATVIKAEHKL